MKIRKIQQKDDRDLFNLIRSSLEGACLNIPGTAYFDESIKAMSKFYLQEEKNQEALNTNRFPRQYFVLVNEKDEVMGGVGFAEYNGSSEVAEVQKLYITDEVKGRGYSYLLMEQVEVEAARAGYKKLYLETHKNLPVALHLYKKLGYTLLSEPLPGTQHSTMDHFFIKEL